MHGLRKQTRIAFMRFAETSRIRTRDQRMKRAEALPIRARCVRADFARAGAGVTIAAAKKIAAVIECSLLRDSRLKRSLCSDVAY